MIYNQPTTFSLLSAFLFVKFILFSIIISCQLSVTSSLILSKQSPSKSELINQIADKKRKDKCEIKVITHGVCFVGGGDVGDVESKLVIPEITFEHANEHPLFRPSK